MMVIKSEGALFLLDKLFSIEKEGDLTEEDIEEITDHPDIQRWMKAYDVIPDHADKIKNILGGLSDELPGDIEYEESDIYKLWEKKIDYGFRKAMDEPDEMLSNLDAINGYDWDSTLDKALDHLPEKTELKPTCVVTLDGFNGGMFRYGTIFLSLIYFDPSTIQEDSFAHELHHMGCSYWWDKDPFIQRYQTKEDQRMYYLVQLHTYLVSEGLANAFCSPDAISEVSGKEKHNRMIREYDLNAVFDQLEELLGSILQGPSENVPPLYSDFTMDKKGRGLPPGHLLSGNMVQVMQKAHNVTLEEIIGLIHDPIGFIQTYNKAAEGLGSRTIDEDIIASLNDTLDGLTSHTR